MGEVIGLVFDPKSQTPKQTYFAIKYHLINRVIKIWFFGGLPTDAKQYFQKK